MSRDYNVLLIEDNPGDARLLELTLKKVADKHHSEIHFHTRWVNLLETGIQHAGLYDYDIIFLDLSLPDSDGLNSIDSVVAESKSVPVLVLTGMMDTSFYDDVLDHGAQGYLVKGDLNADHLFLALKSTITGF